MERCIIGEAAEIHGAVINSVIGPNVYILDKGAVVRDSIIMKDTSIGRDVTIDKSIIAENCRIEDGVTLGIGGSTKQIKRECLFVWTGNDWRRFCCSGECKGGQKHCHFRCDSKRRLSRRGIGRRRSNH